MLDVLIHGCPVCMYSIHYTYTQLHMMCTHIHMIPTHIILLQGVTNFKVSSHYMAWQIWQYDAMVTTAYSAYSPEGCFLTLVELSDECRLAAPYTPGKSF
uniref:Uncharacterized protein n=1 Tax=Cacopsylla melanoneura TaxID=428564 RepID=A0A8D8QWZ6_9HEMI